MRWCLGNQNIATDPAARGNGYGRGIIDFLVRTYWEKGHTLLVGTGDSPLTVPFHECCGFVRSHVVDNFFLSYYDHPIIECGVQLRDMVYMKRELGEATDK